MTADALVRFHTRHKLLLMAHSPAAAKTLGRLVATAGVPGRHRHIPDEYRALFDATRARPLTRGGHTNALQHMVGLFRGVLGDEDRHALARLIEQYRQAEVPLATPLGAIAMHARQHHVRYLLDQVYLQGTFSA